METAKPYSRRKNTYFYVVTEQEKIFYGKIQPQKLNPIHFVIITNMVG